MLIEEINGWTYEVRSGFVNCWRNHLSGRLLCDISCRRPQDQTDFELVLQCLFLTKTTSAARSDVGGFIINQVDDMNLTLEMRK